ncbi:MAG: T9SS type A sorting domain-containing protein [Bacteroidia bacterium]
MKNLKSVLMLICLLTPWMKSFADHDEFRFDTKYSDNGSGVLYSNEIAEQAVTDASGNLYVGGAYNKDGSASSIRVVKYPANNGSSTTVTYNYSNSHNEQVIKMFWGSNSQLYVFCKAVSPVGAATGLVVYRFNSSLTLLNIVPDFFVGFAPEKVCTDGSNNFYVAGTTTLTGSVSLRVIKLNAALVQQGATYNYYYTNSTDGVTEEVKDIIYSSFAFNSGIYIAGRAYNAASSTSAAILIKLNTSLAFQWKKAPALNAYKNVYNSVAAYANGIYVTGAKDANNTWCMEEYDRSTGTLLAQSNSSSSNYESEGIKITVAGANGIYAAGFRKSTALNKYKIVILKWSTNLSGITVNKYTETLTTASKLSDAIATPYNTDPSKFYTYLTGSQYVSGTPTGSYNMFFRAVNDDGDAYIKDSIINNSACGNKIVVRHDGSHGTGDDYTVTVIGYQDKTSSNIQPHDYKFFTRSYYWEHIIDRMINDSDNETVAENSIDRIESGIETESEIAEISANIFPNPTSDFLNVESSEELRSLTLFDLQGKTVMQNQVEGEVFTHQVNISNLPKGIYFLRVNDGTTQKVIKN